ncbi:homeobox protein orthopedia B-like [Mercenaria mercenaria]|uniref:homeobox protein orthopedia B-like n=1 Tax=Mercenaria mercenaria TaxID=6596 RepID=UPI00234E9BA0|nr:homeobox protein orthopedia B-like [Mercenaria mercenaria]
MEHEFEQGKYPDIRRREIIAAEIGSSEARVQVWFQNRRARQNKRCHLSDTCPDGSVLKNTSKRQRVEQPATNSQNTETMIGLPRMATSFSQSSSAAVYHSVQPQLFSAYPPAYFHGLVLPSLGNLQSVCTSLPQETKNEDDTADDIVKRLFRFSARDARPATIQQQQQEADEQQQKQVYRMVVPTKKATDCSVTELRVSESARDVREECVFTLEDEDSGLANDSFSDSM